MIHSEYERVLFSKLKPSERDAAPKPIDEKRKKLLASFGVIRKPAAVQRVATESYSQVSRQHLKDVIERVDATIETL